MEKWNDITDGFELLAGTLVYLDQPIEGHARARSGPRSGALFAFRCEAIVDGCLWHWVLVPIASESVSVGEAFADQAHYPTWISILEDRRGPRPLFLMEAMAGPRHERRRLPSEVVMTSAYSSWSERQKDALLAVMMGCLGEITPRMRAVSARCDETSISVRVYVDGEVVEEEREAVSLIETEVLAAFPDGHRVAVECLRLDAPAPIPKDAYFVYCRHEE